MSSSSITRQRLSILETKVWGFECHGVFFNTRNLGTLPLVVEPQNFLMNRERLSKSKSKFAIIQAKQEVEKSRAQIPVLQTSMFGSDDCLTGFTIFQPHTKPISCILCKCVIGNHPVMGVSVGDQWRIPLWPVYIILNWSTVVMTFLDCCHCSIVFLDDAAFNAVPKF